VAHSKINNDELTEQVLQVFRNFGYEGASLSRLAQATGLEKASLYYRFPGGKKDLALAVTDRVGEWFAENVVGPLTQPGLPAERVREVAHRLRAFYGDGSRPCVLDTLSLHSGPDELRAALAAALQAWLAAFTAIARESGFTRAQAARRAQQALINIEGSLVLARVMADPAVFLRALDGLPNLLTRGHSDLGAVKGQKNGL
jgi:AcrR family transcriptional regulator